MNFVRNAQIFHYLNNDYMTQQAQNRKILCPFALFHFGENYVCREGSTFREEIILSIIRVNSYNQLFLIIINYPSYLLWRILGDNFYFTKTSQEFFLTFPIYCKIVPNAKIK